MAGSVIVVWPPKRSSDRSKLAITFEPFSFRDHIAGGRNDVVISQLEQDTPIWTSVPSPDICDGAFDSLPRGIFPLELPAFIRYSCKLHEILSCDIAYLC